MYEDMFPYHPGLGLCSVTTGCGFCLESLCVLLGLMASLCLAADVSRRDEVDTPRSRSGSRRGFLGTNTMRCTTWSGSQVLC